MSGSNMASFVSSSLTSNLEKNVNFGVLVQNSYSKWLSLRVNNGHNLVFIYLEVAKMDWIKSNCLYKPYFSDIGGFYLEVCV